MLTFATKKNSNSARIVDIRELLWFKVASLAIYSSRLSQPLFAAELGLTLGEWRTLATIAYMQPVTLMNLVDESLLDKGQTSRVVSTLIEYGLIERSVGDEGRNSNKGLTLALTLAGRRLHGRGLKFADDFTQKTRQQLSEAENLQLIGLLDKLLLTLRVRMSDPLATSKKSSGDKNGISS